jgi:hypothetical protein
VGGKPGTAARRPDGEQDTDSRQQIASRLHAPSPAAQTGSLSSNQHRIVCQERPVFASAVETEASATRRAP